MFKTNVSAGTQALPRPRGGMPPSSPSLLWTPGHPGASWLGSSSLQSLTCLHCVCFKNLPLVSVIKTSAIGVRAHPNPIGCHLNLSPSAKIPFPNKFPFTGPGGEDLNIIFF